MTSAYRSAYEHIVGVRLAETQELRSELTPMLPSLRAVTRARMARIFTGAVGVAGALAMTFCAAWFHNNSSDPSPTYALLVGSLAVAIAWPLSRAGLAVGARLRRKETGEITLTGQLDQDLARIDASDPRAELRRVEDLANRLELPSIALPIAGISFLFPLLSHWLFIQAFGSTESAESFAGWIRVSLVIVGHAHLALVICGFLFAKRIRSLSLEALTDMKIHREWLKAWLITISVSCLPGILLILVPPVLVALTGIAFVPFLWLLLHRAVRVERSVFAFAEAAAAVRVAVDASPLDALAEQKQREADRYDEDAHGDADDSSEREPLVVAAHRVGDDGRWG